MKGHLRISEVFGPTIQGEGPSLGRRAGFIRLGGCNLHCSWCDTPYTWDWTGANGKQYKPHEELVWKTPAEIATRIMNMYPEIAVITGGEPLLQQNNPAFVDLLRRLRAAEIGIEVETNGTVVPSVAVMTLVSQFNVSPKLANGGDMAAERMNSEALTVLNDGKAIFKFVCATGLDIDEMLDTYVIPLRLHPVYVMPQGVTPEEVNRNGRVVAEYLLEKPLRGIRMTPRFHVELWGNERAH